METRESKIELMKSSVERMEKAMGLFPKLSPADVDSFLLREAEVLESRATELIAMIKPKEPTSDGQSLKAWEVLAKLGIARCPECNCATGEDWYFKGWSNKTIVICPQCGEGIAADVDVVRNAAESALEHFWASVAAQLPYIKSGDFPPEAAKELEDVCTKAVELWIKCNSGI